MPIYEYRCENGHLFEVMQKITDDPVTSCETCGAPVAAGVPPDRGALQGLGLLQHGLRHVQAQARDGRLRQVRRRQARREEQGTRTPRRVPSSGSSDSSSSSGSSSTRAGLRGQPRRKRATSACLSASSTIRPAPPSGSVSPPRGLEHALLAVAAGERRGGDAEQRRARPCRSGPPCGAAHETHGSRTNVSNEVTLSFIAATSCCWRRARSRSFSLGRALVLAGAGERERLVAVDLRLALLQPQRGAAVAPCRR